MGEISIKSMVIEDVFMSSCTIWSWYEVKIQLVWWDQNVIIFIKNISCNKTNWKSGQFANWWSGGNGNIIKLSLEVTKYCSGWSIDFACSITSIKKTRFRIFFSTLRLNNKELITHQQPSLSNQNTLPGKWIWLFLVMRQMFANNFYRT